MAARPKSNAPSGVEGIKEASNHLRGELAEQLHNEHDYFDESGKQLLKFHGLYQQDDRDQRKSARTTEKTHSFMLRTRVPTTTWRRSTPTARCALRHGSASSFTASSRATCRRRSAVSTTC